MDEIKVLVDVPILEFIRKVYPVSFIVIIVGTVGWLTRYIPYMSQRRENERGEKRLHDILTDLLK